MIFKETFPLLTSRARHQQQLPEKIEELPQQHQRIKLEKLGDYTLDLRVCFFFCCFVLELLCDTRELGHYKAK